MQTTYPFSAVVGLDDLKLALLINAVSPSVGGVLVRGEKGTAKSTIVRALAELLPDVTVVADCRFACEPENPDPGCPDGPHNGVALTRPARLVELPVGASEDRLVGSLDIERALTEGVKAFQPGLLAAAHRGVLYVDEVNLLHDHLVDLLLDAAAMGRSYVEREGVSVRHAARFLLVGTMNPEEGELRPQLLDRFGLTVEVTATRDPDERASVVRRRLAYEAAPAAFAADWTHSEAELAARIAAARALLPKVVLPDAALRQITAVCAEFEVDGLRADLVMARAAIALAAWHGRRTVTSDDVRLAARLALPHRRRRDPFDAPGLDEARLDDILERTGGYDDDPEPPSGDRPPSPDDSLSEGSDRTDPADQDGGTQDDPRREGGAQDGESSQATAGSQEDSPQGNDPGDMRPDDMRADDMRADDMRADDMRADDMRGEGARGDGAPEGEGGVQGEEGGAQGGDGTSRGESAPVLPDAAYKPRLFTVPGMGMGAPGRRSRARTAFGRIVGARPGTGHPHLTATLFAAAPHQRSRGRRGPGLVIRADDLREPVREGREGNLVLFVVDASGSMAARQRMRAVKGAVLSLLLDAYQRRDKVGLITFRGRTAELALPPTSSVEAGARRLAELPTGGRTPLAAGLLRAAEVLRTERLRDPSRRPLLVLVTDGRATHGSTNDALRAATLLHGTTAIVIDCESGPIRLNLTTPLAAHLGATLLRLEDLAPETLTTAIHQARTAA